MLKKHLAFFICLILILEITACSTSSSLDLFLDNGEAIRVILDTTDHTKLSFDDTTHTFSIQKDGIDLLHGGVFTNGEFEEYAEHVISVGAEILTAEPEESPTLYIFKYDGPDAREYVFLQKVEGSDLSSVSLYAENTTYKEAETVFHYLSFERIE